MSAVATPRAPLRERRGVVVAEPPVRRKGLLGGGVFVLGATLLWHASNFAYNALGAHVLGPARYGALAAVIALLYVVSPLLFSLQTVSSGLAARLAVHRNHDRMAGLLRFYQRRLGLAALLLAAVLIAVSAPIADALRLPSAAPVRLLWCTLPLAVLLGLQRGVMQGSQRFTRFAGSTAIEAAVKIAAAALLVVLWPSVEAGVVAVLAGMTAAVLAHRFLLRFLPRRPRPLAGIRHPARESVATLGCLTLLALLFSLDVVLAHHFLGAHEAGEYAGISLCGKIVFFATSGLNWLLYPLFSAIHQRGGSGRQALLLGLAVLGVVGTAIAAAEVLFPGLVVRPLVGSRYASAEGVAGWLAFAYACYAAAYLLSLYLLSRRRTIGIAILGVATALQVAGLAAFHDGLAQIAHVQAVVMACAAAALLVPALRARTPVRIPGDPRVH